MKHALASLLLLVHLGAAAQADGEWRAWVGMRDGTLAGFDQDLLTHGYTAGWRNDFSLRPWLHLRLGADHARVGASAVESRGAKSLHGADYRLEQTTWRFGIVPRLQAGPATLTVAAEYLHLDSEEQGTGFSLFGQGRRSREGFGLGGTSQIPLSPTLTLFGEAAGYRLGELEGVDAGMRLAWRPRRYGLTGTSLSLEGIERRLIGAHTELRERDVRIGLGRRF